MKLFFLPMQHTNIQYTYCIHNIFDLTSCTIFAGVYNRFGDCIIEFVYIKDNHLLENIFTMGSDIYFNASN